MQPISYGSKIMQPISSPNLLIKIFANIAIKGATPNHNYLWIRNDWIIEKGMYRKQEISTEVNFILITQKALKIGQTAIAEGYQIEEVHSLISSLQTIWKNRYKGMSGALLRFQENRSALKPKKFFNGAVLKLNEAIEQLNSSEEAIQSRVIEGIKRRLSSFSRVALPPTATVAEAREVLRVATILESERKKSTHKVGFFLWVVSQATQSARIRSWFTDYLVEITLEKFESDKLTIEELMDGECIPETEQDYRIIIQAISHNKKLVLLEALLIESILRLKPEDLVGRQNLNFDAIFTLITEPFRHNLTSTQQKKCRQLFRKAIQIGYRDWEKVRNPGKIFYDLYQSCSVEKLADLRSELKTLPETDERFQTIQEQVRKGTKQYDLILQRIEICLLNKEISEGAGDLGFANECYEVQPITSESAFPEEFCTLLSTPTHGRAKQFLRPMIAICMAHAVFEWMEPEIHKNLLKFLKNKIFKDGLKAHKTVLSLCLISVFIKKETKLAGTALYNTIFKKIFSDPDSSVIYKNLYRITLLAQLGQWSVLRKWTESTDLHLEDLLKRVYRKFFEKELSSSQISLIQENYPALFEVLGIYRSLMEIGYFHSSTVSKKSEIYAARQLLIEFISVLLTEGDYAKWRHERLDLHMSELKKILSKKGWTALTTTSAQQYKDTHYFFGVLAGEKNSEGELFFRLGQEMGSCVDYHSDIQTSKALLGYTHGKCLIAGVWNSKQNTWIARSVLRVLFDAKQRPVLLKERLYGAKNYEKIVLAASIDKAKEMGIPLYTVNQDPKKPAEHAILHSLSGKRFEYVDSLPRGAALNHGGKYSLAPEHGFEILFQPE